MENQIQDPICAESQTPERQKSNLNWKENKLEVSGTHSTAAEAESKEECCAHYSEPGKLH